MRKVPKNKRLPTRSAQPSLLTQQKEKDRHRDCESDLSSLPRPESHEGCQVSHIAKIRHISDVCERTREEHPWCTPPKRQNRRNGWKTARNSSPAKRYMLSKNTTRNCDAVTVETQNTTCQGFADTETPHHLLRIVERLAIHRPPRLCDRTSNCRSVEKRDCSTVLPQIALPPSSSLGQSVSSIISPISRMTSDPVPTYFSMEITPSMKFTGISDHFQVALRLTALLHYMRSIHGVKKQIWKLRFEC